MITKTMESITHSTEETLAYGADFARSCTAGSLVALQGELGAGKTTFVQGLLAGIGAEPPYPSPTFILMHQYDIAQRGQGGVRRVYHVDAYRVDSRALENVGWDEWVSDPEGIVLVEWPERSPELLLGHVRQLRFSHTADGGRRITME